MEPNPIFEGFTGSNIVQNATRGSMVVLQDAVVKDPSLTKARWLAYCEAAWRELNEVVS